MKIFLVRRGDELETAKALLKEAEESSLQRAQDASARSEVIRTQRAEVVQAFQRHLEAIKSAHGRRVAEMIEEESAFDAQVEELTAQAEKVREAAELL